MGAIAHYTEAIKLKPDFANAYLRRGIAKLPKGQYFAALSDFDTAIRLKPDLVHAYISRGFAKLSLDQIFGRYC